MFYVLLVPLLFVLTLVNLAFSEHLTFIKIPYSILFPSQKQKDKKQKITQMCFKGVFLLKYSTI